MKTTVLKSFLALLLIGFTSCSGTKSMNGDKMFADMDTESYDILTLAATNPELSIVTDLIQKANLDTQLMLKNQPVTLFLPTNEAFKEMSYNDLKNLTSNKSELMSILKRHILPNKVMTYDLNESQIIETSGEEEITISTTNSNFINIGGAQVIKSDVMAKNGVIHIVNRLIEPTRDVL
ncbi:MAG: fasciclin domain-containing protein [Leeuwenhoekiella sp.]